MALNFNDLLDSLDKPEDAQYPVTRLRTGVVDSAPAGTPPRVDVKIGGSTTATTGVRFLKGGPYPAIGDTVSLLQIEGTFIIVGVLASALTDSAPRGFLGSTTVSTNQAGIGTSLVDLNNFTVAITVGTSRKIRLTGHVYFVNNSGSAQTINLEVWEGANFIGVIARESLGSTWAITLEGTANTNPSAGAHTYKLRASIDGSTCTAQNATVAGFIQAEDIGAA